MDGPDVLGYVVCPECGEPTPEVVALVTGGRCGSCWATHIPDKHLRLRTPDEDVVTLDRPPRRVRKGARTAGERKRSHQLSKIKLKAMKRLRDLHQDEYARLLAAERLQAGLDPLPLQVVLTPSPSTPGGSSIPAATPGAADGPEDLHATST